MSNEKEGIAKKAAREAEADRAWVKDQERILSRKQKILGAREEEVKSREQKLADAISKQEETIRKQVDEKAQRIRQASAADLQETQRKLSREYDRKERNIKIRMKMAIVYGVVMTALLIVRLPVFGKLRVPWRTFLGWLTAVWNMLKRFADRIALNSLRIPGNVPHQVLYDVIYWGIIGIIVSVFVAAVVLTIRWIAKKRRKLYSYKTSF